MAILRVVALMVAILGSRSVAERLLGKWQWSKSLLGWDGLLVAGRRINHKGVVFLMTRRQQLLPWCNGLTNPDLFLEQRPQAQSVELHPGDTAAMVGRPQLPTLPQRTMREVFQSALGTLTCDERMRSNMGGDEDGKQDLMPLPVPQADAVVAATVVAINHLGGWKNRPPGIQNASDSQILAVKNLSDLVHRHGLWKVDDVCINFEDFFKRKSVDYMGEEVKVGMTMNWKAIRDSFPQEVGCLDLQRFCRLGTLEYVVNFEDFLFPQQDWKYTKPPRVMVEKDGWWELCQGLIDQKVCDVMPIDQLCRVHGKPLLNGMFAVGKGEYKDGLETQRLIMNLIPVNTLCKPLAGDISTLPGIAGLSGFLLDAGDIAGHLRDQWTNMHLLPESTHPNK